MKPRSIAIVDCDSFYFSVEAVFNPKLREKPCVILSNNDGCVVALNKIAKELGIKRGTPLFQLKHLVDQQKLIALSSNYPLYADFSDRVMNILSEFSPEMERYSIDEAFLSLDGFSRVDTTGYARKIKDTVYQKLGIPVCIGIGPSKTMAKVANRTAKKNGSLNGVCNLNDLTEDEVASLLSRLDISDLWGIGKRLADKLNVKGIYNALELKRADPEVMRQNFSVVMERTIRELNGISCIEIEEIPSPKNQIVVSRSFGQAVWELESLSEAISNFTSRAAEKMRIQGSFAGSIQVFISTSRFRDSEQQYANSVTIEIPAHTNDTARLTSIAIWAVKRIFRHGYKYAKAGVMLSELVQDGKIQQDLFNSTQVTVKSENLMAMVDSINQKMGKGTIRMASEGVAHSWKMKQGNVSPRYTTCWNELLVVD